jgi:Na+/H+ antiporter NhaC
MDYKGIITSGGGVTLKDLHLSWQGGAFFSLQVGEEEVQVERDVLPGWISLLPPIIAIVLAIAFREVVFSLFLGIWLGASFLYGLNPLTGFLRSLDTIVVGVLTERSHVEIILFSLMLGGMIGLITRNGGTAGIIEKLKTISTSVLRGQVATWAMGVFI